MNNYNIALELFKYRSLKANKFSSKSVQLIDIVMVLVGKKALEKY